MSLILFNKPYGVISQFSAHEKHLPLSRFISEKNFYPAGRLDHDSEGLLILTDEGKIQHALSHPKFKQRKTYWVQVDGDISDEALSALETGIDLKDGRTLPASAKRIEPPNIEPRQPPVRYRATIPTSWCELSISEGKNRQVRRMTAAVGFPTLRLIRYSIGSFNIEKVSPGEWTKISTPPELQQLANSLKSPRTPGRRLRAKPKSKPIPKSKPRS